MWIVAAVGGLLAAWLLLDSLVRPERNASRETMGRGILTLMRRYEDTATMTAFRQRSSVPLLRFERAATEGDSCEIVMEVLGASLEVVERDALVRELDDEVYELTLMELGGDSDRPDIVVRIPCPDIWRLGAEMEVGRLNNVMLDTLGIGYDERFGLRFRGPRSIRRTRELWKRQKSGENLERQRPGIPVPVGASAPGRLGAYLGYAAGVASRWLRPPVR